MSIAEGLLSFINNCPYLDLTSRLGVDYLGSEINDYSIDLTPTTATIQTFLNGSSLKKQNFLFASRNVYSKDQAQNITNSGFFEDFQTWIESQNLSGIFPILGDNKKSQEVKALTGGYLMSVDGENARYQIQCELTYLQEI